MTDSPVDLQALTVDDLHALSVAVRDEMTRRDRLASIPGEVCEQVRSYVAEGGSPDAVRQAVEDALNPPAPEPDPAPEED